MNQIKTALISLSDKSGIVPFATFLAQQGVKILSTGGTASLLRENGIQVTDVSEHTGFPEIMNGRVKTLHPKIHGGLLALRENAEHMATLDKHGITPIDLVIVNLYPFEKTISAKDVTLADAIENIDIGGPCMLRASAKNYQSVTVITEPQDYDSVMQEMKENNNSVSFSTNQMLACKVFQKTSSYDQAIATFLQAQ